MADLTIFERLVAEALAGDEITDWDIEQAELMPSEWCPECAHGRNAAAVTAARIAVEALREAVAGSVMAG